MSKAKKTKTPQQRTELDGIVTQLRTILRRDTTSVIEKGRLLLRSRELLADEHGQWMPWLAENFDMSYRSAINYCNAAEYVARKAESATVADLANVAPTLLYRLAEGGYAEQEEMGILAQAKTGKRVDQNAAYAICEALEPPDADDAEGTDDQDDGGEVAGDDGAEDAESKASLDGPPPAVPPPAPTPPPPDFALQDFDQAINVLKRLMTKLSAQFVNSIHSGADLESVACFIGAVTEAKAKPPR